MTAISEMHEYILNRLRLTPDSTEEARRERRLIMSFLAKAEELMAREEAGK